MSSTERRQSPRLAASPLKVEFQVRNWKRQWQKPHHAIAVNLSKGGLSILSPIKLKQNQTLMIGMECQNHRLGGVLAKIIWVRGQDSDFVYGLEFQLDALPVLARHSAHALLSRLEASIS